MEEDEKELSFIAEFWNKDQSDTSIIHIQKSFLRCAHNFTGSSIRNININLIFSL